MKKCDSFETLKNKDILFLSSLAYIEAGHALIQVEI